MIENLDHVFTLIYGEKPKIVQQCLEKNKFICDKYQVPFKIISFDIPKDSEYWISTYSDYLRLKYASENSCVWYVDWDLEIKKIPVFSKNSPKFAQIVGNQKFEGAYDIFTFYNGDRTEDFKKFIDFCGPIHNRHNPYFKKLSIFWKNKNIAPLINNDYYYHHYGLKKGFHKVDE